MERYHVPTPLGGVILAAEEEALTGLWFENQACPLPELPPLTKAPGPVFRRTEQWLELYFSGQAPDFCPPLFLRGTPFRLAVWDLLQQIPFGQTVSYGQLAARLARQHSLSRLSARAVGGAVGRNPISIIVPCHRVVGADGSLVGYAGGTARKRLLLQLERTRLPISGSEAAFDEAASEPGSLCKR